MSGQGPVGNVAESVNALKSTLNVLTGWMVSTFVSLAERVCHTRQYERQVQTLIGELSPRY